MSCAELPSTVVRRLLHSREVADDSGGELKAQIERWRNKEDPRPSGLQLKSRPAVFAVESLILLLSRSCRHWSPGSGFPTERFLSEVSAWWTGI